MKAFALMCLCLICICGHTDAQDSIIIKDKLRNSYLDKAKQKAKGVEKQLTSQSWKVLNHLQKQQYKVYQSLHQLDSNAAKAFLISSQQQYATTVSILDRTASSSSKIFNSYVPGLDSMNSVLGYLNKFPGTGIISGTEKLQGALAAANKAHSSLDATAAISKLIQQQKDQLKALTTRYKDLNIAKQLKAYNKEIYYYGQRVQQAKEVFNDPSKIEGEVLRHLRNNKAFQGWMQQNSQLARLFGAPGGTESMNTAIAVAGLQTRQSIEQTLQQRLGGSLQQAQQQMAGVVQDAQGQLSVARNHLQQLSSGSFGNTSNIEQPDFKPNNQKTKSFLQRLEYGFNLQSQKSNRWLPSTSDIGLSVGYKLNDKSTIGIGAAYKLGWGQPVSHIRFSHQGVGLRSYFDYKLKGNFWVSGGYELNYQSAFNSIEILRNYSAWLKSGLVGLNKKIKSGKCTVQTKLLWDFLSYQQVPKTQPLLFRIEYKLK